MNGTEFSQFLDQLAEDQDFQLAMLEEELIHRVALRVMQFRKALGLSQEQLGQALGITQPRIANIEAGEANLSLRKIAALAYALRCTTDELLLDEPEYSVQNYWSHGIQGSFTGSGSTGRLVRDSIGENWSTNDEALAA